VLGRASDYHFHFPQRWCPWPFCIMMFFAPFCRSSSQLNKLFWNAPRKRLLKRGPPIHVECTEIQCKYILELPLKYPKLGVLGPGKRKSGWKQYTGKKKRGSNQVFLPSLLLICFIRPRLVRVKSSKSCELYPVSIKWSPVLLKLQLYWNWGWNRDYRIKIGTNNRVTLRITLILGPKTKHII